MHSIKDIVKQLIGKSLDAYNKKYTSPINNRIDNIVAQAGNDNTEIVDARIDSAGVTHTTLNNRILAETKMNVEQLVEYTGSSLSVDDTMPGYLQNIEIKGNTIQNEDNLEDIRSVGDKIEGQELYEIPVLSCGKNLFNSTFEIGGIFWNNGLDNNNELDRVRSGFIKINPNATYRISEKNKLNPIFTHIFFFDKNKTFISFGGSLAEIPNNTSYIRFLRMGNGTSTKIYLQIEEGTVATEYEPYQEDKLTILSPVQLEKVGDVADRIIYKDGVWGVEKNVKTVVLDGSENWSYEGTGGSSSIVYGARTTLVDLFIKPNTGEIRHLSFPLAPKKHMHWNSETEGIHLHPTGNHVYVNALISRFEDGSLASFKKWLQTNPQTIKFQLIQPQFIPLPHDQQVKLRTFANKTNISFLTEIEGTIKAQVPKSLGATVNTHTEQISNLNKELDRVKKLEESTVSTVETESDFTTVEATSNGYFEDVKLEGKTLVNHIGNFNNWSNLGRATISPDGSTVTIDANRWNCGLELRKDFSEGEYYFSINNKNNATIVIKDTNNNTTFYNGAGSNIRINITLSTKTNLHFVIKNSAEVALYEVSNPLFVTDKSQESYFEGLKSVGQDVDEIVVSSVNKNLFDGKLSLGYLNGNGIVSPHENWVASNFINIQGVPQLNFESTVFNGIKSIGLYDSDKEFVDYIFNVKTPVKIGKTVKYVRISMCKNPEVAPTQYELDNPCITMYINSKTDKKHQSDKKRLLFYNNETQTWEKPVLREWDSIEKHTDGKYYYHQRSGEVVLNGSENWITTGGADEDTLLFYMEFNAKPCEIYSARKCISDKINSSDIDLGSKNIEGIYTAHDGNICIRISKTKLSTQDVAGFKQWLQANNVTVVYQLAEEKVYECTNIDLITYANETNYIVESGAIVPRTTLKVHNNISNIVSLLQKKVSLLESNMTKYMITQNRMQLSSTYSTDSVTFKVDYFSLCGDEENYDEDLYNLILNNILVGKDNYNYDKMFTIILDYASWNQISWEQFDILVGLMDIQHNPPIEELPPEDVIEEDIIENEETPVE